MTAVQLVLCDDLLRHILHSWIAQTYWVQFKRNPKLLFHEGYSSELSKNLVIFFKE